MDAIPNLSVTALMADVRSAAALKREQMRELRAARAQRLHDIAVERRRFLPTREAALHLGRSEQTLRNWACAGNGLISPQRQGGRLAWPVSDLKAVLRLEGKL